MNHAKPLLSLMLAGFLSVGCSGYDTKSASAEDFQKALNDATLSLDNAKKSGFEWRDSRKLLEAAEKAAKEGDFNKAIEMANQAKRQGELAIMQSKHITDGPHG